MNTRWLEPSLVSWWQCVRNTQEGRNFAENSVHVLMPRTVEGIRVWVVVKMHLESLNFSVVCRHKHIAVEDQRVSSYFSLKIFTEATENTGEWRLRVCWIVLKAKFTISIWKRLDS